MLTVFTIFPIFIGIFLGKNVRKLDRKKYREKYGALYLEINVLRKDWLKV